MTVETAESVCRKCANIYLWCFEVCAAVWQCRVIGWAAPCSELSSPSPSPPGHPCHGWICLFIYVYHIRVCSFRCVRTCDCVALHLDATKSTVIMRGRMQMRTILMPVYMNRHNSPRNEKGHKSDETNLSDSALRTASALQMHADTRARMYLSLSITSKASRYVSSLTLFMPRVSAMDTNASMVCWPADDNSKSSMPSR